MEPLPLMAATIKLSMLCGTWGAEINCRQIWKPVMFALCLIFWYILPSALFIIGQEKSFIVLMKPVLELFAITMFVFRTANLVICRKTLYECYGDLQQCYDKFAANLHEDVQKIVRHVHRSADLLPKFYIPMVFFQAVSYGWLPATLTIVRYAFGGKESVELPSTVLEAE